MKQHSLIILFCILILVSCSHEKDVNKNSVQKLTKKYEKSKSISYKIDYEIKFLDLDDTTKISANATLIKAANDSLFGGYFWLHVKDSVNNYIKYYNLNNFYIIDNNKREVVVVDMKKNTKFSNSGFTDNELIRTYFLKTDRLKNLVNDTLNSVQYLSTKNGLEINVKLPDEKPIVNQFRSVSIDKSKQVINKIIFNVELDNLFQYSEWSMDSVEFNNTSVKDLEKKFKVITKNYSFKDFNLPTQEESAPKKLGVKAPNFKGSYFPNSSSEFELNNFKDKIIVLDFWYKNCQPCINSIPQINNIYKKYSEKGVQLFGLNEYDNNSKSKQKLLPFIKQYNMEYPIVFVDSSVTKEYKVHVYPTLYIIDKNGEIVFSKTGHSEQTEKEIDSVLSMLMK